MFGPHLTLDLYSCSSQKIADSDFIYRILDELPGLIGMHKISKPSVIFYPGKSDSFDKGGISAFVIIAESHIAIHTFLAQEFASVDIFSCKPFDIKKAENYFVEKFEPKKIEKHLLTRGREFPRDFQKVQQIVMKERKKMR